MTQLKPSTLSSAGLFAGIGGIEIGLEKAGFKTRMVCEIEPGAAEVLRARLGIQVEPDIRKLRHLPRVDLLAAGFPCQDLSQAGRTAGILRRSSASHGLAVVRMAHTTPHELAATYDSLAAIVSDRLTRNERIRRTLPEDGRVRIDRQLPFVCVYRSPSPGPTSR